ncbi:hypothetical protein EOS_17050 [Caballeronia mineralivorans PML1(12)]|uniref:Beta-galactosidase trimerisation domain-containing protein n=1 Tax=Caballeronia mineralivorans PML1(12) TaxID=908627 RepID=A0A0J1CX97_9BURK|nr:beta-galactosidase trimerization domain-containing protein [Caballeronia mineralivorans]KLU24996.1 hypothetical protein EOS_17050 [Caballeronia mineralivorans PML1(12)]
MKEQLWYKKQLRIYQTVLREVDLIDYDAARVVEYLVSADANCLVINAGGVIDFFQNKLEFANISKFVGSKDIIQELTEECHSRGIRVIARVDFRGAEKRVFEQRPDAFAVDEACQPQVFNYLGHPLPETLYTPCYLGWYRNEHAFDFARHLFEEYNVDGIWENASMHEGVCYCKRCQAAFMEDHDDELPRGGHFAESKYDTYRAWKSRMLHRHLSAFRREIKKFGDDKAFCAEIFGLFYDFYNSAGHDLYNIKDAMDFLVTPLFIGNHEPLNGPGTLTKFLKALDEEKTPVVLFGHLGMDNQLRYVSNSPAELKIWMWQALSAGGSLWDVIFNGQHPGATYDRRNEAVVRDVFRVMKRHEGKLHSQKSIAPVGIFYSQKTNIKHRRQNRAEDHYLTNILGLEQTLQDRHLQYDFVLDLDFSAQKLTNKKLLIIPHCELLSDTHAEVIRAFVSAGGHVISTGSTALRNEVGELRDDFALTDVFGCSYSGLSKDSSKWGYQWIRQREHPVMRDFEQTQLIANWGECLLVEVHQGSGAQSLATYVPAIYPQPPEKAWLTSMETPYATVIENVFGDGRSIYFATEVDRNVWHHGHPDYSMLLGNTVSYMLGDANRLSTNAPASVQMTISKVDNDEGGFLLHVINVTSSPRRPVVDLVPVRDISIALDLPARKYHSFEVLTGDASGVVVRSDNKVEDDTIRVDVQIAHLKDVVALYIAAQ